MQKQAQSKNIMIGPVMSATDLSVSVAEQRRNLAFLSAAAKKFQRSGLGLEFLFKIVLLCYCKLAGLVCMYFYLFVFLVCCVLKM